MHLFLIYLCSLFLGCKFSKKAENVSAFALVQCLALYYIQHSLSRHRLQLMSFHGIFSNTIRDFLRKAFNESFHPDMLKCMILKSEKIQSHKIILITVVTDL